MQIERKQRVKRILFACVRVCEQLDNGQMNRFNDLDQGKLQARSPPTKKVDPFQLLSLLLHKHLPGLEYPSILHFSQAAGVDACLSGQSAASISEKSLARLRLHFSHNCSTSVMTHSAVSETAINKVSILGKETIHLGFHLIPYIVSTVLSELPSSTYVLITDTHLAKLHLSAFQSAFEDILSSSYPSSSLKARFFNYEILPGERSKSRQTKADIEDWLLKERCTRDIVVLALGGGVVGDLTGFVCATFMRGVRYCQIPTTLLAMVDSAVGGKVCSH